MPVNKNKLAGRVIDDLIKAGILEKKDKIEVINTFDIKNAYVIFDKNRKPVINKIHKYLKSVDIIPCGRYGDWAYHWSDESILSGKKAVKKYKLQNK